MRANARRARDMDELLYLHSHKTRPKSHLRLVRCQFLLRIRIWGKRTPIISLKVPKTGCQDYCFQSRSTQYLPPFQCLPTSSHARTLTYRNNTHARTHETQTARRAVLPGTLRERRRAPGLAGDPITTPGPVRPLSPSGRDDRLIIHSFTLYFQRERTVPRSGQPGQPVEVSPHQDPASGGPAADRNLQGLAYGAPAQATCGMSLIRDSRYRRNSINPSALSVRPPPLDANIERWGNVSIPTSPTGRVGTRLRLIVGRLVFIIAL